LSTHLEAIISGSSAHDDRPAGGDGGAIMSIDPPDEAAPISYAYKASLVGAAHRFELTGEGLSWRIAGKSGVWPYAAIAGVRLSYRPVSMQSRRFRADIDGAERGRIALLSTSWQTSVLMSPQDHAYRVFIVALHRRMAEAGSNAVLTGGLQPRVYIAALVLLALVAVAMTGLLARAIMTGELAGILFLVGFAALFGWQVGGFVRRNRPQTYTFDRLPEALLP
jgi:hypothetical protein